MAEDEKPKGWDISRSHVPNLEDFLQGLYVNQFVSVEPTSAQFSALSARVAFVSAHAGGGSATSQKVSAAIAVETSDRISADNALSNAISLVSQRVSTISQAISIFSHIGDNAEIRLYKTSAGEGGASAEWCGFSYNIGDAAYTWTPTHGGLGAVRHIEFNAGSNSRFVLLTGSEVRFTLGGVVYSFNPTIFYSPSAPTLGNAVNPFGDLFLDGAGSVSNKLSALSQAVSVADAALSVRIDTQSNAISVLSNQISALSQSHSALSNTVSVISNQVSALSQAVSVMSQFLSVRDAALSVRIDTQSQSISVLSNKVSVLSQQVSVISQQVSVLSARVASNSALGTTYGKALIWLGV